MTRRAVFANSAFTLIELLVVISIIGTLMGMSLVMIPRVRESSNVTKCAANLTQWGQAIKAYTNDWGGRVPSTYTLKGENPGLGAYFSLSTSGNNNQETWWMGSPVARCPSIYKYFINTPGNTQATPIIGNTSVLFSNPYRWYMNSMYGSSSSLLLNATTISAGKIISYSQVRSPSKAAMLACGYNQWNKGQGFSPAYTPLGIHYSKYAPGTWSSWAAGEPGPTVDDGKTNFLSFDGNIRLMKSTTTTSDYDDDQFYSLLTSSAANLRSASYKSKWQGFWNNVGSVQATW